MEPHSLEAIHRGKALGFPDLTFEALPSEAMAKTASKPTTIRSNGGATASKRTKPIAKTAPKPTVTTKGLKRATASKPKLVPSKVVNSKSSRRSPPKSAPKSSKVTNPSKHRFSADSFANSNANSNLKTKTNRNSADSLS